jgi:hypothetical protein
MNSPSSTAIAVICPSCGETYASPDRVTLVLRNSGFCINLTCLQDLTHEPLDAVLRSKDKATTRRWSDRPKT